MTVEPSTNATESTVDSVDSVDSGSSVAAEVPDAVEAKRPPRFRYTVPGLSVALVFACLAFTPSLVPRGSLIQGALCGVNAAIGYGLGVLGAWVWRAFADRDARPARRRSWQVLGGVAAVALLGSYLLGRHWQGRLRELMAAEPDAIALQLLMPVVAVVVFVAVVAAGRGLRRLYRWLAAQLSRWIGPKAATAVGWVAVVGFTAWLVSGVLLQNLSDLANQTFSVRNGITQAGVEQPTSSLRSGGPDSLVSWDSLGREGRTFMAGGPSRAEIADFTGAKALEPIRAFAGLETADDSEERAAIAVRDLERAGGFDREYLMVATTTGSGWVSPGGADSFEYMVGGDSAIVAMQYSYLPSWISYLVDQANAREAGRDLFDAVYARWLQLPADERPKIIAFGESLGTFGAETAFSGEFDLANRTSGALLTGPPNFNTLWGEFTRGREAGTPEIEAVYRGGRIVRFTTTGQQQPPGDAAWGESRVLYVQHPSDPIVWWSPNLLLREPDWLDEPRGEDVLPEVRWAPFVTFWQLSADLLGATSVPAGHGHDYGTDYVDGWADVLQPAGWTTERRDALQRIITAEQ